MKTFERLSLIIILICLATNILQGCGEIQKEWDEFTDEIEGDEEPTFKEPERTPEPEPRYLNDMCDDLEEWDDLATGTVYKPVSERNGNVVVVLSPKFQQAFDILSIGNRNCRFEKFDQWDSSLNFRSSVIERAKEAGNFDFENNAPFRQVWRCDFRCGEVQPNSLMVATDNINTCVWQINNPCERY